MRHQLMQRFSAALTLAADETEAQMFSKETMDEIETVAREEGIEAAALLAVADVESGGRAYAFVGGRREPLIRFEGHYFDRLVSANKREAARQAGLASPKAGAVANPNGQVERWKMLNRAAEIDRDAALQSVSWGIGQVMGSHWKALGYENPQALADEARRSVGGQVRLMVRFCRVNRLLPVLARHDWAGFARAYNGPAYKKNHYDTKLAAAHARFRNTALAGRAVKTTAALRNGLLRIGARGEAVSELQHMLTACGFFVTGDGVFGPTTEKCLKAFQTSAGLTADGICGAATRAALMRSLGGAKPLPRFWRRFLAIMPFVLRFLPKARG